MASKVIKTIFQFRRATTAEWDLNKGTTPAAGEPCFDLDKCTLKIGNGKTTYENLPVIGGATISEDGSLVLDELQADMEALRALVGNESVENRIAEAMANVATAEDLEEVANTVTTLESQVSTSTDSVEEFKNVIEQHTATVTELQEAMDQKADATAVEGLQATVEQKADVAIVTELQETVEQKADVAQVIELQTVVNQKADTATVAELQETVEQKADAADVTELQTVVEQKADASTVIEIQTIVEQKADQTTVTELQTIVEEKVDQEAVDALETSLKTYVDEQINNIGGSVGDMDGGVIE